MKTTVSAIFDSYSDALAAVERAVSAGVPRDDISVLSNDRTMDRSGYRDYAPAVADDSSTGAGTGASLGAVAGGTAGILAGLGILAIPGLGPVVAAGWLAATLVGAGAGAAAGGLVGALTGVGLSDDDAHVYAEGIRRGGTMVSARVESAQASRLQAVLEAGSYNPRDRSSDWRSDGWTGRAA